MPGEIQDRLKHCFGVLQHPIVPESQDKQTLAFKGVRTRAVDFFAVLRAIEFNDQPQLVAIKICDVRRNRVLASEFETTQASCTQVVPEFVFGVGAGGAQRPGRGQGAGREGRLVSHRFVIPPEIYPKGN